MSEAVALIWLRDDCGLNQGNDWARRWLKLDKFGRHLGYGAKDFKERGWGVKGDSA